MFERKKFLLAIKSKKISTIKSIIYRNRNVLYAFTFIMGMKQNLLSIQIIFMDRKPKNKGGNRN